MNKKQNTKIIANAVGADPVSARGHRGITLVALIITVIVMLILVGVSIAIALNGGLFDTTKNAAKKTEKAKKAEQELSSGRIKIDDIWYDSFEDYVNGKESAIQGVEDLDETNTTFIYNPAGWTSGEVKVSISTTALRSGYTMQYSTDGVNWSDYIVGTEIPVSKNGAVYAKLIDNMGNEGDSATSNVENIDTVGPTITTALNSPATTTSSIDLSIGVTDTVSGFSKIEWYYKESTASTYTPVTPVADTTMNGNVAGTKTEVTKKTTLSGLNPDTTYNIYAIVYDVAGNPTRYPESGTQDVSTARPVPAGDGNITFSYSDANWTNQSVDVTIAKTSALPEYTLQYSTDGSTFTDYSSPVTLSSAGKIYARLRDASGTGGPATSDDLKIDTEAPTINTHIKSTGATGNSINLSITITDTLSGFSKIEWYYKKSTETNYTTIKDTPETPMNGSTAGTKTQTTKTKTLTGLTSGTKYDIYAIVYDVAGNPQRSPSIGDEQITAEVKKEECTGTLTLWYTVKDYSTGLACTKNCRRNT